MKILTTILVTFLAAFNVFAAEPALSAQQVLDNVVNSISTDKSLTFNTVIQNGAQAENARLVISKRNFKYDAGALNVFYDGTTQWTVDNEAGEVTLTNPTPEEISETNPLAFVQSYKAYYNVSIAGNSGGTYTVKLEAREKTSYIRSANVVVSSKTWLPTHITATLSTGQTLTLRILSVEKGDKIPASGFRFDTKAHPDYEIIDLR